MAKHVTRHWGAPAFFFIVYFSCPRLPCVFTLFFLVYFVPYLGELLGGTCSLPYLPGHNYHKRFLENETEKEIKRTHIFLRNWARGASIYAICGSVKFIRMFWIMFPPFRASHRMKTGCWICLFSFQYSLHQTCKTPVRCDVSDGIPGYIVFVFFFWDIKSLSNKQTKKITGRKPTG